MEKAAQLAGVVVFVFLCLWTQQVTPLCFGTGTLNADDVQPGRLEGSVVMTVQVPSLIQCLAICAGRSVCLSVNYNAEATLCEINYETSGENTTLSTNFTQVATQEGDPGGSWVHVQKEAASSLNLAGVCSSQPCLDEETCVPKGKTGRQCIPSGGGCKDPPVVENASVQWTGTSFKDEAFYNCSFGFRLAGNGISKCLPNGRWLPVARCLLIDCGAPPVPARASVTVNGTLYLDRASYRCSTEGDVDTGTVNESTCLVNSTWSAVDVRCAPVDCGAPPSVPNADVAVASTAYNGSASYNCVVGYEVTGGSTTTRCQASGLWEPTNLQCTPINCGTPPAFQNATAAYTNTTYGSIATYSCPTGFLMAADPNSTIQCNSTGAWIPSTKVDCNLIDCGAPPVPARASVTVNGTLYLDRASYRCSTEGDVDTGTVNESTCLVNSTWSAVDVRCAPVDCGAPPSVPKAQVTVASTTYSGSATYSCVVGYEVTSGSTTTRCQASGLWEPTNLQCTPINCGTPPAFQDATAAYTNTTYGSNATYSCPSGFIMTADSKNPLQCGSTGAWGTSTSKVFCAPVSCYKANPTSPQGYVYKGTVSVDRLGRTCQRWDSNTPHSHQYGAASYHIHDGGATNASNYCRIVDETKPWCISSVASTVQTEGGFWAFCTIPAC